jgi:amidase
MSTTENWQSIVKQKRTEALNKIPKEWILSPEYVEKVLTNPSKGVLHVPKECGLLTTEELKITESYDAVDLTKLLAAGSLTSVALTTALCKRAAIAQQLASFSV